MYTIWYMHQNGGQLAQRSRTLSSYGDGVCWLLFVGKCHAWHYLLQKGPKKIQETKGQTKVFPELVFYPPSFR